MPSFDRANRSNNDNYWTGIRGILAIQLAVLFVLSVGVIAYLNWSSNAALVEFTTAGKPAASEPSHQVKSRTACPPRA